MTTSLILLFLVALYWATNDYCWLLFLVALYWATNDYCSDCCYQWLLLTCSFVAIELPMTTADCLLALYCSSLLFSIYWATNDYCWLLFLVALYWATNDYCSLVALYATNEQQCSFSHWATNDYCWLFVPCSLVYWATNCWLVAATNELLFLVALYWATNDYWLLFLVALYWATNDYCSCCSL